MRLPDVLVAFPYYRPTMEPFLGDGGLDWVLDSGAYSALGSGKHIELEDYIEFALGQGSTAKHIFALDVIGDPEASLSNAVAMRDAGVPCIPTWHDGSPLSALDEIASEFDRIAIGGMVGRRDSGKGLRLSETDRLRSVTRVFDRVWPKWIHGFGLTGEKLLTTFPFASVDSTTWSLRPGMYGQWKTFGGAVPVRVSKKRGVAVTCEIAWFMDRQARHAAQWRKQLDIIGEDAFTIKLACGSKGDLGTCRRGANKT